MCKNKDIKTANVPPLRFTGFTDDWKMYKLKELCKMLSGGTPALDNQKFWNGEIPFISASAMHFNYITDSELHLTKEGLTHGSKLLKKNNLLLLVRGSMLWKHIPICYNLLDIAFNQDVKGIIINNQTDSLFMLYWFEAHERRIKYMVTGTGIGAGKLDTEDLLSMNVLLPHLNEQNKIYSLFRLLDERIAIQSKIIDDLKKLRSAIRWKIFSDLKNHHTKAIEVGELLAYEQPSPYIVTSDEYVSDSNKIPVLTANKGFILGYTDEPFGIYQKGNCIIFDDFTMDVKYVTFPFKVKSSAIKILTAKPSVNLRFMFEYLQKLDLKSEEHKRHYISEVATMGVSIPSIDVQNHIASILVSIDNKLMVEQNLANRYEEEKQYLLSNMFI